MATLANLKYTKSHEWVLENADGTVSIGITDYAPMNYKDDNGEWTGFDTEFAELVCKELGVKAEFFVLSDWDQKVNELNSKAIDVVWNGMTITDELKKSMSISDPYVINAQVIVTKAENAEKYVDLESIKDATIAVETGSAGAACVADCANVTEVAAQSDALLEVKSGAADVCVIDITMADAMTGEIPDFKEQVDGVPLVNPPLALYKELINSDAKAVYFDTISNKPKFLKY